MIVPNIWKNMMRIDESKLGVNRSRWKWTCLGYRLSPLGHSFPGPHLWPQNAPPWQATITADSNGMNAVRVCKLWRDPKLAASGVLFRNTQAQNLGAVSQSQKQHVKP